MDCALEHPYRSGRFGGDSTEPLRPGGLELTRRAVQCAGFTAGQRILDLGCGTGAGTQFLRRRGCVAIGLDALTASLAAAVANLPGKPPLVAANAGTLPFATASMDGILAECSLSVINHRRETLAECYRVLRPGGHLAITDVFARVSAADDPPLPDCLAGMAPRDEIMLELADAGFHVERWEDHSTVLNVFMARLIFESGASDALWADDATNLSAALRRRRPGYFLSIAAKAKESA